MKRLILLVFPALVLVGFFFIHSHAALADTCGGVQVATPGLNCTGNGNPIYDLLNAMIAWIIRILVPLAILAIIIAGIQYITSQGNPDGVKAAKTRLTNAVIGVVLLILMGAILQFLGVVTVVGGK